MNEVMAALLGALVAGLLQTILSVRDRKRRAESVLTAVASKVDSICRLMRHQNYLESVQAIADGFQKGMWNGTSYVIDIRQNYFSIFEGLVSEIGILRPADVVKIVNFYAYCRSAIDSTRPDGPHALYSDSPEAAANMVSVATLLSSILSLGDEIVRLPKVSPAPVIGVSVQQ